MRRPFSEPKQPRRRFKRGVLKDAQETPVPEPVSVKGLEHGLGREFWTRHPFLLLLQLGDESHTKRLPETPVPPPPPKRTRLRTKTTVMASREPDVSVKHTMTRSSKRVICLQESKHCSRTPTNYKGRSSKEGKEEEGRRIGADPGAPRHQWTTLTT